jgi:prolyl-tRNA synthetase
MGEKTIGERFAGAENTYTLEAIMQDGQALQCATSHYLGQNFSKVYDVNFQTNENKFENVYQMSAGISTRIIGAIIMSHADDKGLMLPIGIAPTQIALLPVLANKDSKVNILVEKLYKDFHTKYRTYIDNSNESFGYKVSQQEVEGTPIIIVVGPKEANEDKVTLIRRDNDTKATVSVEYIINNIDKQIHNYQLSIYEKAEKRLNESIIEVKNIDEFNQAIKNKKIIKALWGGDEADEKQLKIQTSASPRCIDKTIDKGTCFFTNKPAKYVVYFGRAY